MVAVDAAPPAAPPGIALAGEAERALLIACARPVLSAAEAARVRQIAGGAVDWELLVRLAARHRLVSFVHRHLRGGSIPGAVMAGLGDRQRAQLHATLAMAAELRRVMGALAAGGIEALAYKGPALAMRAYGDLSLRPFDDLDLLVRPDDVPRALGVLAAAGYDCAIGLSAAQERWFRRVDGDYPLVHRQTGTLVELHARVSSLRFGIAIDTDDLIRRSQTVRVGGGAVRTLGDDDLLLVLFVHGAKHRWRRLEWLAAVAALLRAGRGDVDAVLSTATELRARRTAMLGLHLAHTLLGAPIPGAVRREAAADAEIAALAAEAVERMFGPEPDAKGEDTRANLRFNLRLRESVADRARFAAAWLFGPSPEDWGWKRLPDALFPLYRLLRPVRLLGRHVGAGSGR
jgi:hypothetical protein